MVQDVQNIEMKESVKRKFAAIRSTQTHKISPVLLVCLAGQRLSSFLRHAMFSLLQ
jgi:hypothetical protein